ncbi:MAG: TolC family protein [Bacteroidales bacterium]|nr:TolC family protein [Bacteroidales bacterium]
MNRSEQTDSLYYYLELAGKNNPTVLQKYYEYLAALQKIPQAGSLPDPELSLGVFLKPMELVMGKQIADVRLMQMFPWFGTLKAAKDEMSLMSKARFESFREAKLQLYYDVQSTWYDLYKLSQKIRISDKNVQILKTLERLALVRFRTSSTGSGSGSPSASVSSGNPPNQGPLSVTSGMNGMSGGQGMVSSSAPGASGSMQGNVMGITSGGFSLADLYLIQMEIAELENDIALLKNQQTTTAARFNSYLNRPLRSPVAVADTLEPDTMAAALITVSDSILKRNPMLGMLRYEEQSFEARKRMVSRMGYPMLGLGVDYSLINKSEMSGSSMNGSDMIMPMVSATLPFYRKKYRSMQTEADLLRESAAQNYIATSNSLQTEYLQAVQLYEDASRRMRLYSDQYILAKKSLDIKLASFSAGSSNLTDIFLIQQQVLDYELKQVEAVADYNTAIAWMVRLGDL